MSPRPPQAGIRGVRTAREMLAAVTAELEGNGVLDARREAALLLDYVAGIDRQQVLLEPDRVLSDAQGDGLEAALARRIAREPITRIAGQTEFYGRPFRVTPDVLDPRADSESLIDLALTRHRAWAHAENPRILDVGTGSGCLLATLLAELPEAYGIGLDVSEAACAVARANLVDLGLGDRAKIIAHDADLAPDLGTFNLIVSNPPYIAELERAELAPEVVDFDPSLALFAGPDGLNCYRAWLKWLPAALANGGGLILEIGWTQGSAVTALVENAFEPSQNRSIEIGKDLSGRDRSVAAWTRW